MGSAELSLHMVACGQQLVESIVELFTENSDLGISLSMYSEGQDFLERLPIPAQMNIALFFLDEEAPIPNPFLTSMLERQPDLPVVCLTQGDSTLLKKIPAQSDKLLFDFLSLEHLTFDTLWAAIKGLLEKRKLTSELKESHHKLELFQQEYSSLELSAGMAHDANNALGAVLGHLKKAEGMIQIEEQPDLFRALQSAIAGCRHVAALMHDHVALTKNEEKKEREVLNLRTLIQETCQVAETLIPGEIKLHYQAPQGLYIDGEKHQLERALINLILNAVQATEGSGTVSIRSEYLLHEGRDSVQIAVADQGSGISPQILPRIFDPFFSTKKRSGGSGLGLALVSRIIADHSGEMFVSSEVGVGSEFRIVLPEAVPLEEGKVEENRTETELLEITGTVLIIDDSQELLDVSAELLQEANLSVAAFSDPDEAIQWYQEHFDEVDLVLLDMQLPGTSGGEVNRKLQEIKEESLVLIYSGTEDPAIEQTLAEGAKQFLKKPIDFDATTLLIKELIAGASSGSPSPLHSKGSSGSNPSG